METPFSLAPRACAVCPSKNGLLCCSGCQVVFYCGKEHQQKHQSNHKESCTAIKKTREALQREETKLRAQPADILMPADVFNTRVGQFWGILGTRDYMRARFAAANALLNINNTNAVEKALDHFIDMLRLCRADNLGVRDIIPFLQLRLGREQECYDFLKWYATVDRKTERAFGDHTLPFLNIRNANTLEPVDVFLGEAELGHLVAITFLKLRLYLDLDHIENEQEEEMAFGFWATNLNRASSPDEFDRPIGKLAREQATKLGEDRISEAVETLKGQYLKLCRAVNDKNPHFWAALVDDGAEPAPPPYFSHGSPEEAALILYECKRAWDESEDAISMIEASTAKFTRAYQGSAPIADASTSRVPETGAGPRHVLMLCLDYERMFDEIHAALVSQITSKAASVQRATTVEDAVAKLNCSPPPSIILVADGAITRHRELLESVVDRLRGGATVVLAGCFCSLVNQGQFDRLFKTIGLPWKRGNYNRETVKLRRHAVGNHVASQLPSSYSQNSVFVENVEESAIWYAKGEASRDAAVVFTKVGKGNLGYVGDPNAEDESVAVVMAMCGF